MDGSPAHQSSLHFVGTRVERFGECTKEEKWSYNIFGQHLLNSIIAG